MQHWTIYNKQEINPVIAYIERILPKAKRGVNVAVTVNRPPSSTKQKRYYRGVIVAIIAEQNGYKKTEHELVHKLLLDKFCPAKKTQLGDVKSTVLLNTIEMEQYEKDIRDWYEEFTETETGERVIIPLPNETANWNY